MSGFFLSSFFRGLFGRQLSLISADWPSQGESFSSPNHSPRKKFDSRDFQRTPDLENPPVFTLALIKRKKYCSKLKFIFRPASSNLYIEFLIGREKYNILDIFDIFVPFTVKILYIQGNLVFDFVLISIDESFFC